MSQEGGIRILQGDIEDALGRLGQAFPGRSFAYAPGLGGLIMMTTGALTWGEEPTSEMRTVGGDIPWVNDRT